MTYTGWLIYNKQDSDNNTPFIDWFLKEALHLNIELKLIKKEDLLFGVKSNKLFFKYQEKDILLPDFAIMRNLDQILSKQLEYSNVLVHNNSFVSGISNHKAKTHQYLANKGIPMIDTLFVRKSEFVPEKLPFAYPIILKEVIGRRGEQVYKVTDHNQLKILLKEMSSEEIIIQRMGDVPGKDIRVFVVGDEIIAAILRYSSTDFRSNYSLGGKAKLYPLTEENIVLIKNIINQFKNQLGFVGIDFIFENNGSLLFNEIEDVVGSRTLSANTEVNIVNLYLKHVISTLNARNSQHDIT